MAAEKPRPPRFDWDQLEREFILNTEYPSVATWFKEAKGWSPSSVRTGNFKEKTLGWGTKRASFQDHITNDAIESAKQVEKERVPQLLTAKLNLVAQVVAEVGSWDKLTAKDKKLVYEILKNELGEPTSAGTGLIDDQGQRIPILGVIGVVDGRVRTDNGAPQDRKSIEAN